MTKFLKEILRTIADGIANLYAGTSLEEMIKTLKTKA